MPTEIVDKILSFVNNANEKIRTRRVCRGFRDIIDSQLSRYKAIYILVDEERVIINFDKDEIIYEPTGCIAPSNEGIILSGKSFIERMESHLHYVLNNPRLKLNEFRAGEVDSVSTIVNTAPYVELILSTLNHQLHVKTLYLPGAMIHDITRLLRCFKPGVLESIYCVMHDRGVEAERMEEIYELDQWKLATYRDIDAEHFLCDFSIVLRLISQANQITVQRVMFIPEEIVQIRETLFKLPNLKYCSIWSLELHDDDFKRIESALGEYVAYSYNPRTLTFPIPGSDEFLKFDFMEGSECISIIRTTTS